MKLVIVSLIIIIFSAVILLTMQEETQIKTDPNTIRYVAIGDSYTIAEGVSEEDRWPNILTNHLQRQGIAIELVANPSVTGWTTQQAIDHELPVYEAADPDFATLLIGVNDWVQGVDAEEFRQNLIILLDRMQAKLEKKDNLIVITIPDFSATPAGKQYGGGRDISIGIAEFNAIIKEEANKRSLPVVDIYPLSQKMEGQADLMIADGLHPSAKEYALWEELIFPEAYKLLK